MATNPQAEGQTTITFQVSEEDKAVIQELANKSGMKLSAYIRAILTDAMEERIIFQRQKRTESTIPEPSQLAQIEAKVFAKTPDSKTTRV